MQAVRVYNTAYSKSRNKPSTSRIRTAGPKLSTSLEQLADNLYYTRKNRTAYSKSANKPSTSCVRMACYKLSTSLEQAVNNLQQPC